MIFRMMAIVQMIFDAFRRRVEHPEFVWKKTYRELQSKLVAEHRSVVQMSRAQLALGLRSEKAKTKGNAQLCALLAPALKELAKEMIAARQRISCLEDEIQAVYTEKQISIAKVRKRERRR